MSENLAGKKLKDRYNLDVQLGSGGFGTIYLARDTYSAIGGTYVVKHFAPCYENDNQLQTAMRLFQQEADTLQKLGNHPQIPRMYDFFEEGRDFFLVQEFIEGKTVEQELKEVQNFDLSQACKFLNETLGVLKFIHEAGYIHRDIKPSNLIINRFDNRVFLIDFGAVKEKINPQNIEKGGKFNRTVGILSPGYTPAEQLEGRPEYCSDIYALGMVVIQAMTGKHPSTLERNINYELIWRDFLPAYLDYDPKFLDLIDKMVERDWQRRYKSAYETLQDLQPIIMANQSEIYTSIQPPRTVTQNPPPETTQAKPKTETEPTTPQGNKIKLFAGLGLLGVVAVPFFLYLSNLGQKNYITYENEDIKIEYPADWKRENRSNFLNNTVVFISPKENSEDKFQERVAVIVEESSRPLSLTEYTNQSIDQIENLDNFILSPPKETVLDRSDGKYIVYQGMDRDTKVKRKEVWTVNYRKIYTVIYTAEPSSFDKFLPDAEKMIDSLEILR